MRSWAWLAASTVLAVSVLLAPHCLAEGTLTPEPTAPSPTWEGQQYAGADDKGRVYVLRPKDFLVYPLKGGELGKPTKLERSAVGTPAPVLDAAIDGPRDWVALFGGEVRWIRSGKEKTLPKLNWSVAAVTLLDGQPVVAVYPTPVGRPTDRELRRVPLLLSPNGSRWSILAESDRETYAKREERAKARVEDAVRLLTDSRGSLWLASTYRYRLLNFSGAGDELLRLEVDGAEIHERDEEEVEEARLALEKKRAGHHDPSAVRINTNTAVPAIRDLVEGRDGRIYLLTQGVEGGGLALDRFDRVRNILERAPLDLDLPGAVSLAAGKHGLYFVPFNGERQRHMLPWEAVEAAEWTPVEGVEINGMDAAAVAEG